MITKCIICQTPFEFDPVYCCSGEDCGCQGKPIDPPVCSNECYEKMINKWKEDTKGF